MQNKNQFAAGAMMVIASVALVTYALAFRVGFVWDDWGFLQFLISMDLPHYLAQYFDPNVQIIWYRPMYGLLWGAEYILFGTDPTGYHLVNVLLHTANCLLLFKLVERGTRNARVAFLSAIIYAGLPLLSEAVLWPADAQPLATLFSLLALWFWWSFLERTRRRDYFFGMIFFAFAVFSKETSVTLIVILFLFDRLVSARQIAWQQLARRYFPLTLVLLIYFALIYRALSYGIFINQIGYRPGGHALENLFEYLTFTAFPFGFFAPFTFIWLAIVALAFGIFVVRSRNKKIFFLAAVILFSILPVLPQLALKVRYIYVPAMVTCFLIAIGVDRLLQKIKRAAFALSAAVTIALFVFNQGLLIAEASVDRAELSREERVPFRTIAQRHPQFSPGTYLYFINGWAIYWSTMFQMRYGQTVQVEDIFTPRLARFADRQNPILIYFNARGDPTELAINPAAAILKKFSPPLAFEAEINLTGYELPLPRAQRGEPLPLILYWQAQRALTRDYTVFVHLLNANAEIIQGVDSQPRGGGAPTSKWEIGTLTPDGILLPIPSDAPPGIYRVEIGLYDLPTLERLQIRDANGARVDDKIVIESIEIVE